MVIFDTQDRLGNKLDKITSMMNKLTAQAAIKIGHLNLKCTKAKRRGQMRHYYDQGKYQNRYRSNSGDRIMSYKGRAQYGQKIYRKVII